VLLVVEGLLDALELGEVLALLVAHALQVGDDRLAGPVPAVEDAQLERVAVDTRADLLEAGTQVLESLVRDAVERLVRSVRLPHAT
jgi:hypothetical protein